MKTIEVNGREYKLKPPRVILQPYLRLYSDLVGKETSSFEEAEKTEVEIKRVIEKIFELAVEPRPLPEDEIPVLMQIANYVAQTFENAAGLFRRK